MRAEVVLDFLPSRYDRDPATLADVTRRSATPGHGDGAFLAVRANLLAYTEVTSDARMAALFGWPGWGTASREGGGRDEIAVKWREDTWRLLEYTARQIGPDLGPGGPVVAGLAVLEHRDTGERLVLTAAHLPATVEGDWSGHRAREHRKAVQEWRAFTREFRRLYKARRVVAVADWNLSLFQPWVRAWVRTAWPGLRLAYRLPRHGTHAGGRLIDWFLTRGLRVLRVRVLPAHQHSDHRGIRLVARFRRKQVQP